MPHIHDKIDFTVEVFVVYKDTVLLRKHDKYKMWLSVGGHIELDEDPVQAAVREVKEEVGLEVTIAGRPALGNASGYTELVPPKFLNRHNITDTHEHLSLVYFATTDSNAVVQGENERSDAIHWFTQEELDDPQWGINEHIKHYAKTALQELAPKA